MNTVPKLALFLLRISLGYLFLSKGVMKILDASWSAEHYLSSAKNFPSLYNFFLQPQVLPVVNMLGQYGMVLIGLSLILGFWMRLSTFAGIILMILLYLATLDLHQANPGAFVVDEYVIYIMSLLVLASFHAGRVVGLDNKVG